VLSEIDETAKATFRSITLDTMLMLARRAVPASIADRQDQSAAASARE
jgi:hypothetical protein